MEQQIFDLQGDQLIGAIARFANDYNVQLSQVELEVRTQNCGEQCNCLTITYYLTA